LLPAEPELSQPGRGGNSAVLIQGSWIETASIRVAFRLLLIAAFLTSGGLIHLAFDLR
jgi:hypothetical protein